MPKHAKKKPVEESRGESAPIWIISFADLVVLLMSFFVILTATAGPKSTAIDPEFADIVAAIKKAFKYVPPANSADPVDLRILLGNFKNQKSKNGGTGKPGEARQRTEGVSGKHDLVTTIRTGTQTTIGGYVSFAADTAELTEEGLETVRQIADRIRGHMNVFMVKGHTSRDEEYKLRGASRDLSYARADAVVQALVEFHIAREGLRIQSCRDFEPIREGTYNEVSRAENRRVEVIATEALVSEYRGTRKDAAANRLADLARRAEQKIKDEAKSP